MVAVSSNMRMDKLVFLTSAIVLIHSQFNCYGCDIKNDQEQQHRRSFLSTTTTVDLETLAIATFLPQGTNFEIAVSLSLMVIQAIGWSTAGMYLSHFTI